MRLDVEMACEQHSLRLHDVAIPRCALRWRRPSPSCVCRRCPSSLRSSSLRRRCESVWGWQGQVVVAARLEVGARPAGVKVAAVPVGGNGVDILMHVDRLCCYG